MEVLRFRKKQTATPPSAIKARTATPNLTNSAESASDDPEEVLEGAVVDEESPEGAFWIKI